MVKKKIVLDTNILISALGWKGKPREIFIKLLNKEFELVSSYKQLEELSRVMDYAKFTFTREQKKRFITLILEIANLTEITGKIKVIEEDEDDNIIIETAEVGQADFIISGDEHLLKLKEYNKIKIVTASNFLEFIN
ncbi:putative toxin-antitoxin system toxin component, PIN family [Candidatus Woesearchaeota archaeon]|nr:putative toxin-antitoxin system toxin component, PIN family [Candidatus Woesearchaeota archaeon]